MGTSVIKEFSTAHVITRLLLDKIIYLWKLAQDWTLIAFRLLI